MTAQMDGRPPSMSLSRHLPLVPFSHAAYLVYWQLVLLMARTLLSAGQAMQTSHRHSPSDARLRVADGSGQTRCSLMACASKAFGVRKPGRG